jgi:hypothetical protein
MSQRNIVIAILGGAFLVVGLLVWGAREPSPAPDRSAGGWEAALLAVDSIHHESQNHIHGIGYDSQNERLFVATHFGLFVLKEEQLYQIGRSRDDFMGFSLNQRDPDIIYTSGHPRTGGNLGVMRSEDAGLNFERISQGTAMGPVDFHSMALSFADPGILYGVFKGQLYRSRDAGNSWELLRTQGAPLGDGFCWHAPCISADTMEEGRLYAGTVEGLAVSDDYGENWRIVENDAGVVVTAEVDPQNNERIFAFAENYGVAVSEDGGRTWVSKNHGLQFQAQELVFAFSFDINDSQKVFLVTNRNQIFMTENGGEHWEKVL